MTVLLSWRTYPIETRLDADVHKSGSLELLEDTESAQNVTRSQLMSPNLKRFSLNVHMPHIWCPFLYLLKYPHAAVVPVQHLLGAVCIQIWVSLQ